MSSVKKQEAAVEIAATEATLEILQQEEECEIEELQRLEAEEQRRVAKQETEAYKRRLEREKG